MSVGIPVNQILDDSQGILRQIRQVYGQRLQAIVEARGVEQATYRDLLPTDVNNSVVIGGLTNPNALSADVFVTDQFPNFTLDVDQAAVLYGFADLGGIPGINELDCAIGVGTPTAMLAKIFTEQAYAHASPITILSNPVFYLPRDHVNLSFLSHVAISANANPILVLGLIAEKVGRNVTPRSQSQLGTTPAST